MPVTSLADTNISHTINNPPPEVAQPVQQSSSGGRYDTAGIPTSSMTPPTRAIFSHTGTNLSQSDNVRSQESPDSSPAQSRTQIAESASAGQLGRLQTSSAEDPDQDEDDCEGWAEDTIDGTGTVKKKRKVLDKNSDEYKAFKDKERERHRARRAQQRETGADQTGYWRPDVEGLRLVSLVLEPTRRQLYIRSKQKYSRSEKDDKTACPDLQFWNGIAADFHNKNYQSERPKCSDWDYNEGEMDKIKWQSLASIVRRPHDCKDGMARYYLGKDLQQRFSGILTDKSGVMSKWNCSDNCTTGGIMSFTKSCRVSSSFGWLVPRPIPVLELYQILSVQFNCKIHCLFLIQLTAR